MGDTSCLSIDPIIREAIETGPTARSLELPSTVYTRGGTKLESVYIRVCVCVFAYQKSVCLNRLVLTNTKDRKILTETNYWRKIGKLGITDTLRNGQAGNGEARYDIRFEELEAVIRAPFKDREYVLGSKDPFLP